LAQYPVDDWLLAAPLMSFPDQPVEHFHRFTYGVSTLYTTTYVPPRPSNTSSAHPVSTPPEGLPLSPLQRNFRLPEQESSAAIDGCESGRAPMCCGYLLCDVTNYVRAASCV
jgi:hypothetical protein